MPQFLDIARVSRLITARWAVYLLMLSSLSLAYCAAIIIGLYVQNELTFDRFLPQIERVYLVSAQYGPPGRVLIDSDRTPAGLARWLKSDVREVEQVARLETQEWPMRGPRRFAKERFYWADANFFEVLQFPALYGNLKTALVGPGNVVLTRRLALAYFGRDNVLGQTLTTNDGMRLTITCILKDMPGNTHLDREMFASASTPLGSLYAYDHNWNLLWPNSFTYVTFKPGVDLSRIPSKLVDISRRHWQGPNNTPDGYQLILLKDLHLRPHADGELRPRGHLDSIIALIGVAGAILALACINFSGLILAERNERSAESMLHRALGARRADLMRQVLKEALFVNILSVWLGLVVAERLLTLINTALDIQLSLWGRPAELLLSIALAVIVVVSVGGILPAIVVSRPGRPDRTPRPVGDAATMPWRGWVIVQLSLVIVLLVASHTMARQWVYANTAALGFDGNNVVMVRLGDDPKISAAFAHDIASVRGVTSTAESWGVPTNDFIRPAWISRPGYPLIALTRNSVDPDFFGVYHVGLLAGRNLSGTFQTPEVPREVLLNLAAVKALGFASPQSAIGTDISYDTDRTRMRSTVVGVLPNIRIATLYEPMRPMIFDNFSKYFTQENIRISPDKMVDTLHRIDALWDRDSAGSVPIERRFFGEYLLQQYHDLHQQIDVFYIVSALAILLSIFGLSGLSIFLTRHQMREMAIRRALGATYGDIFQQRIAPFVFPLLFANLIAWPVAWLALKTWLGSFAEHVTLSWLSFIGAGAISVLFGLLTIAVHSALTVRDVPVSLLRVE